VVADASECLGSPGHRREGAASSIEWRDEADGESDDDAGQGEPQRRPSDSVSIMAVARNMTPPTVVRRRGPSTSPQELSNDREVNTRVGSAWRSGQQWEKAGCPAAAAQVGTKENDPDATMP
jgi:hypothetical protein